MIRPTPRLAAAALILLLAACEARAPDPSADDPAAAPGNRSEAAAPPALEGRVLATGCRQGECNWLRVARLETVETGESGTLRRLVGRVGTSRHGFDREPPADAAGAPDIAWADADETSYAYCSTVRPAYAFPDDAQGEGSGRLIVHFLDPFDLAGYQLASARLYMRVCHDVEFAGDDDGTLRRLGYRPGTRNEQIEGATPAAMTRF